LQISEVDFLSEVCAACYSSLDDHSKEMIIECMVKILDTWDDDPKKLPHYKEEKN